MCFLLQVKGQWYHLNQNIGPAVTSSARPVLPTLNMHAFLLKVHCQIIAGWVALAQAKDNCKQRKAGWSPETTIKFWSDCHVIWDSLGGLRTQLRYIPLKKGSFSSLTAFWTAHILYTITLLPTSKSRVLNDTITCSWPMRIKLMFVIHGFQLCSAYYIFLLHYSYF